MFRGGRLNFRRRRHHGCDGSHVPTMKTAGFGASLKAKEVAEACERGRLISSRLHIGPVGGC